MNPFSPFPHGPHPGIPVGAVMTYAGPPAPASQIYLEAQGWMVCDGRSLTVARYPELFAVIGYLYGGSAGTFLLPDYRGLFLRGVDQGTGRDPDAASRTAPPGGEAGGVGSTQADAFQNHQHHYNATNPASVSEEGNAAGTVTQTVLTAGLDDDARASQETRPTNVYVYFIIRYRS